MKRMWIGVGILLLMLGVGIWLNILFLRWHIPLADAVDGASEAARLGDWEKAKALALNAKAHWDSIRQFVAVAADHEPLEEMDALFARLEIFAQWNMPANFAAECSKLSRLAIAIAETQSLTWWTFL